MKRLNLVILLAVFSLPAYLVFVSFYSIAGTGNGLKEYYTSDNTKPMPVSAFLKTDGAKYVCAMSGLGNLPTPPVRTAVSDRLDNILKALKVESGIAESDWQIVSFNENSIIDNLIIQGAVGTVLQTEYFGKSVNGSDRLDCVPASHAIVDKFGDKKLLGISK